MSTGKREKSPDITQTLKIGRRKYFSNLEWISFEHLPGKEFLMKSFDSCTLDKRGFPRNYIYCKEDNNGNGPRIL